MFDHVSIGARELARTKTFYDAALAPLGYKRLTESADSLGYGADTVRLWILATATPVFADARSGLHICLTAPSRRAVREFYDRALRYGGSDNGAPGLRPEYRADYYAAFVADPDGYRIEAYFGG